MAKRITVLLPDNLFDRFESFCDSNGFKKSTLIARLVRDHLDHQASTGTEEGFLRAADPKRDYGFK